MKGYEKIELIGEIEMQEETSTMRKAAASIINLPTEKQQDLQYFSAVYVSTGTNLNFAHFLGSEIVAAKDTIAAKALDIEHIEDEIIGHIYDYAFMDMAGNKIEINDMTSASISDLDANEFHVVIAGIIYKNRFPEIAEEMEKGEWKVSMESYYQKYDVKIGNLIISLDEAKVLGLDAEDSSVLGKAAKVIKAGKEIAQGTIARVLRGVMFSGCGIVKNPANPPSVVLETANRVKIDADNNGEIIVLSYDKIEEASEVVIKAPVIKEESEIVNNDTLGICVSYKKEVIDTTFKDEDTKIVNSNWCTLYDKGCASFSRDTSDPDCLRNKDITKVANACIEELLDLKKAEAKEKELVMKLKVALDKATELI